MNTRAEGMTVGPKGASLEPYDRQDRCGDSTILGIARLSEGQPLRNPATTHATIHMPMPKASCEPQRQKQHGNHRQPRVHAAWPSTYISEPSVVKG